MLFTAPEFIFLFLPVSLLVYVLLVRAQLVRLAAVSLIFASLIFYSFWKLEHLILLLLSIGFNYYWGNKIYHSVSRRYPNAKRLMLYGVAINLATLFYFKYANFFISNVSHLTGVSIYVEQVILPLGISFFTFQQIAYLVDTYRGEITNDSFLDYCLFVTFFPQLIAGPIVHHKELMPQISRIHKYSASMSNISLGLCIFLIGLFKKLVLADSMAAYANPVFNGADNGEVIAPLEAWFGALAYTLQLYFDFSGYSDMAIGGAKMFGINIRINFNSPYKSASIVDFWRRWHISLSNFLRDYLYIPLGGNRFGVARQYINLFATMLLGGLWHGAGWNFVLWGVLHGFYLSVNHFWKSLIDSTPCMQWTRSMTPAYYLITFISVVVAWVLFRAETFDGATVILSAMFSTGNWALPYFDTTTIATKDLFFATSYMPYMSDSRGLLELALVALVAFTMPNSQQLVAAVQPFIQLSSARIYLAFGALLYLISIMALVNLGKDTNAFIYFNF